MRAVPVRDARAAAPAHVAAVCSDRPKTSQDVLRSNTGWQASPERWRDGRERQARLMEQTRTLADRLEAIGIQAVLPSDVINLGAVTGLSDRADAYRSIKFLPTIAQRERKPVLNALRYLTHNRPWGKWVRYAVVTAGDLVPAGGPLRQTAARLKRDISRWASEAGKLWGMEILFRGVEYTRKRGDYRVPVRGVLRVRLDTPDSAAALAARMREIGEGRAVRMLHGPDLYVTVEPDGWSDDDAATRAAEEWADDWDVPAEAVSPAPRLPSLHDRRPDLYDPATSYYHVHANVLYLPRKPLAVEDFRVFLSWTSTTLGTHWDDRGRLEKPDEAIKYSFKPAELDDLQGDELAWLFAETFRSHDVQPMGRFRQFLRGLAENVERSEAVTEDGEVIEHEERRPLKIVSVCYGPDRARLEIVQKRRPDYRPYVAPQDEERTTPPAPRENIVFAVTTPSFRFTPYAEPVVMVGGYTPEPTTQDGRDGLATIARIRAEARDAWYANGAPNPATAIALAQGWEAAANADAARRVTPLMRPAARPQGAPFPVHTSGVTVPAQASPRDVPTTGPPPDPPDKGAFPPNFSGSSIP